MPAFTCESCSKTFTVATATIAKFHGWQPKRCFQCKNAGGPAAAREGMLTTAQVLAKYVGGPTDGVFTDGSADPNPGPGGWGAAYVVGNTVAAQQHGHEGQTTNNRMELVALIRGAGLVPLGTHATLYTDSRLCADTVNVWAPGWEARGWKRKQGPIKNLELVQELCALLKRRPELTVKWIEAHAGNRWNEYADALATAYRRKEV